MTDNAKVIYNYLKDHSGEKFTISEIQNTLGLKGASGTLCAQEKKGNVERAVETVAVLNEDGTQKVGKDGEPKTKEVTYWTITAQGLDFDPDAE